MASGFGVLDFFAFGVFQCVVDEVLVHLFQPFVQNIDCLGIKHLALSLCVERVVVLCSRGFWVAVGRSWLSGVWGCCNGKFFMYRHVKTMDMVMIGGS